MDPTEEHVRKFLVHRGHSGIRYEPDGPCTTPDFAIDGEVAVEVRRLNQHHRAEDGSYVGLEDASRSFSDGIERLVQTMGPPLDGETWFVAPEFRRPIPTWKELRKSVKAALVEFQSRCVRARCTIPLQPNFALGLWPASSPLEQFFLLGGHGDRDSGGWVFEELHRNLQLCLTEKNRKTARARASGRYREWWLILVDQIGYGRDAEYRDELVRMGLPREAWSKIVLVSPVDHTRAWEL